MTSEYLNSVIAVARNTCQSLDICFLTLPEETNLVILQALSISSAHNAVQQRCADIAQGLRNPPDYEVTTSTWETYGATDRFSLYADALTSAFYHSRSFKKHCRNQVFRNLQPILRKRGVFHSSHSITESLATYLLQELALKLYVANENIMDLEYGPEREMEVVDAIYAGKYPELIGHTSRRLRHIVCPYKNVDEGLPS